MRADSLAVAPHLCNSVDNRLSHLFFSSLQYFNTHREVDSLSFINQLRVLVGLSYAAYHRVDNPDQDLEEYQKYFCRFIQHGHGDFHCHWGALLILSQALAKLVIFAIKSFHCIPYPNLYRSFMQVLTNLLNNPSIIGTEKADEVQQLLSALQEYT